jgi:hypothetical protein
VLWGAPTNFPSSADQFVLWLDQMWTYKGLIPSGEGPSSIWLCADHSETSTSLCFYWHNTTTDRHIICAFYESGLESSYLESACMHGSYTLMVLKIIVFKLPTNISFISSEFSLWKKKKCIISVKPIITVFFTTSFYFSPLFLYDIKDVSILIGCQCKINLFVV